MQKHLPPIPPTLDRKLGRLAPLTIACLLCTTLTACAGGSSASATFYAFILGNSTAKATLSALGDFGSSSLSLRHPAGRMVQASNGQIFGVAEGATTGSTSTGAGVFAYSPGGSVQAICQFSNPAGPYEPSGGLAQASNGSLYGVTVAGGSEQDGTVYRMDPSSGSCQELYPFTGGSSDGGQPLGAPFLSRAGNLYVTSSSGGRYGQGVLVELSPNRILLGTLYQFGANGGPQLPIGAPVEDPLTGSLYGTTQLGGANGLGNGSIHRID